MMILAPSVLSADFTKLGEELKATEENGAKYIHYDVMDGDFVPSISFGMPVLKSISGHTDQVFDVHMMVTEPGRFVEDFAKAGADIITVHAEACKHLDRTIQQIKDLGLKAGVVLNPATPLSSIEYVLEKVDMVLLMGVNPGFGGQKFIPYVLDKVRELKKMIDERGLNVDIELDGGVNISNVEEIIQAGVNVIVAGSAVFNGNTGESVRAFMEILNKYE